MEIAPTDKQIQAILNMSSALHWNVNMPYTKLEASTLIGKMAVEIQNRLSGTGQIAPMDLEEDHPMEFLNNDIF